MPEITVSNEERPSVSKYVAFTLAGILLVWGVIATVQRGDSPGLTLVVTSAGVIVSVGILFVMIQSLIEEWFNAAEITDG